MGVLVVPCCWGWVFILYFKMPQEKKFVEVGRVVHITSGPSAGEIGCIVDIIDAKRLLVDGPKMPRREIKLKDMFLTRILLKMEKALSHKPLMALWKKFLVDQRYAKTVHAQRLEKKAKREACTDFEFFKVRMASRQMNKIIENSVKNLTEKYPRALAKMERKRRVDMGVKLGYRKVKQLTPEERAVKDAREKIMNENRKTKSQIAYKLKKEDRARRAAANKERIAKKKASGALKIRAPLPKDKDGKTKRVHKVNKTPNTPHVSSVKLFRRARDADRKSKAELRAKTTQALQENRAAIKKAKSEGVPAPKKLRLKAVVPKRSTVKKQTKKRQEANKAKAAAAAE